ncbi:hypothetical protein AB0G87_32500 [Streptomyces asoensis]|uniref:hypothetical protein n=1 Tax=Streptomyces asoensis TaxID=249586 RepID=UPI0033F08A5C
MDGFFGGLEQSLRDRNWHAVLVMSLTLPDICVKASDPSRKTNRTRYAAWFEQHVGPSYTRSVGAQQYRQEHKFLSGDDCYALRCALLHEGSTDTSEQRASDVFDSFRFFAPGADGNVNHMNQDGGKLYLMVDVFAKDMLAGARAWWDSLTPAEQTAAKARQLTVTTTDGGMAI